MPKCVEIAKNSQWNLKKFSLRCAWERLLVHTYVSGVCVCSGGSMSMILAITRQHEGTNKAAMNFIMVVALLVLTKGFDFFF